MPRSLPRESRAISCQRSPRYRRTSHIPVQFAVTKIRTAARISCMRMMRLLRVAPPPSVPTGLPRSQKRKARAPSTTIQLLVVKLRKKIDALKKVSDFALGDGGSVNL